MSLQKLIHNYASYNSWANSKYYDWLRGIDETLLYKKVPSSFNSIDKTIQHILKAQLFWTDFIALRHISNFDWLFNQNQAQNNLLQLKNQSVDMKNEFLTYSEEELMEFITLNESWAKNKLSRYEYIMHVINHSTFHRGQMLTIARGLGIQDSLPSTDYNFFNC